MANAQVTLTLQTQAAAQIRQTVTETKALTAEQQRATQQAAARATAEQRLATALGQTAVQEQRHATETARTAIAQANATAAAARAEQATLRLAAAQERGASTSGTFASQIGSSLSSSLLGIVGPAALAATALGALGTVANSFKEAFAFKAQLDEATASINVQLKGVRDSSQVFAEAARFANTYKLTQQETTDAIRASLPVIRQSRASTEEILGTLARLRVLNPEQDFAGAARALGELKAGQVVSIVDRFNIARSAANEMKKEIEGGADAVQVLSKYLDSAGVGMDALKAGTVGASGALRDLNVAQEQLKLAQANFAQGPGLAIIGAQIGVIQGATNLLTGDFTAMAKGLEETAKGGPALAVLSALMPNFAGAASHANEALTFLGLTTNAASEGWQVAGGNLQQLTAATTAAQPPLVTLNTALGDQAIEAENAKIKTAELTNAQSALAEIGGAVKGGLLTSAEGAAILAANLQLPIDKARELIGLQAQIANNAAAVKTAIARAGATDVGKKDIDTFGLPSDKDRQSSQRIISDANTASQVRAQQAASQRAAAKQAADDAKKAAAEAGKIADAQQALDLARAKTSAEKIAIYKRQLAGTTDRAEQLRIEAQIAQEQNSAAKAGVSAGKARVSAAEKALSLEERIRDSKEAQYKAQLDIAELTIRDRQQDREDAGKLRTANAILNSPNANADLKARAADAIALIGVQDAKRANELSEKGATAGGAIINGRVFQSQGGGGAIAPNLPAATGGSAASTANGGLTIQFLVSEKMVAEAIIPNVMDALLGGIRQVRASKGA